MPKKMPKKKARKYLPKLDPLLLLAAARAPQEKKKDLSKLLTRLGTTPGAITTPSSVRDLPVGIHTLAAQMSATAVQQFVHDDLVPVLVDSEKAQQVQKKVKEWKGTAKTITPTTLLVRTPRSHLSELASLSAVKYVEANMHLEPHCDLAHLSSGLLKAGNRTVLETGQSVLVGIVDTGIDASHPAFQKNASTRIINYLDQTTGQEYDESDINSGSAAASPDEIGHGTHVAGIAAGNGGGSNAGRYAGVAPEADLAIVKTTFDSTDIAAGVAHIFEIADQRGQPSVVNLSLGGHYGGHDGSSVTERTIDQLSGPGRIVVVSAGNEGGSRQHAGIVLPQGQPSPASWAADFELMPRILQGMQVGLLTVQVWHQHEDDLLIRLRSPNGELFEPPQNGQAEFDRNVFLVQCSHQPAVYSGDYTTTFLVLAVAQVQWLNGWTIIAQEDRASGKAGVNVGAVHVWILSREMGRFTSGHARSHLVGMPGTSFSAITVASYATRKNWKSRDPQLPDVSLDAANLEDISYFSSPGPTRDAQNKPDVAGPGQWLISALSTAASVDEMPLWLRLPGIDYAALQGTSMAAPYVTGAIALLLQKNPDIDWAEVKRRLIKSAKQDPFTAPCWNARWGYGKISIEALLTIEP